MFRDRSLGARPKLSKAIFGMVYKSKHPPAQILDKNYRIFWPKCFIAFLDTQINGAMYMTQRTCGIIPITKAMRQASAVQATAAKLQNIKTFGGWVMDTMGLGKTFTSLLFLTYYAECGNRIQEIAWSEQLAMLRNVKPSWFLEETASRSLSEAAHGPETISRML